MPYPATLEDWSHRTELLLGSDAFQLLQESHLLVVGLGGVGGAAIQALARAGIGSFTLVDNDTVSPSNINRQIVAYTDTVGLHKTAVTGRIIKRINPQASVEELPLFVTPDNVAQIVTKHSYTYVIDAIDSLSSKCALIRASLDNHLPIISSMGAGAKADPTSISVAPIHKTHTCALAKAVRTQLRKQGVSASFPTVFSTEPARSHSIQRSQPDRPNQRPSIGTISYMPQLFGLHLAAYVIQHITQQQS